MKQTIISSLAALFLVGLLIVIFQNHKPAAPITPPDFLTSQGGLAIDTPKTNYLVASPLAISGSVDGSNQWTGYEGQVGTVKLTDSNGKFLGSAVLTATTDWTKPPVKFATNLKFAAPETTNGTLVFTNENPSGLFGNNREFRLLVKFKWDE